LPPTEIFLQKSFNPNPASPGGTTNLEFTITNFSRDFEATNVTFTDDLTAVLAGLSAIGTPINDVCGTGSQLTGTTNLTFTGGTIPPEDPVLSVFHYQFLAELQVEFIPIQPVL